MRVPENTVFLGLLERLRNIRQFELFLDCLRTQLVDQYFCAIILEVVLPKFHRFIMENLGFAELDAAAGLDPIQFVLHGQLVDDGEELSRVFGSHGSL